MAYDLATRKAVEHMRRSGKTYVQIQEQFKVPKSTLSVWFNKKYPSNRSKQLQHLRRARVFATASIINARIARESVINKRSFNTAKDLPLDNTAVRKALLAMLYWAEGAKHAGVGGLRFVNTDPLLAELFIDLLRSSFSIQEANFKIRLHLHYYHKASEAVDFWSKKLRVPAERFGKIYWKQRSKTKKFRKNFMGICFIYYSSGEIRKEILSLGHAIHAILPTHCPRS